MDNDDGGFAVTASPLAGIPPVPRQPTARARALVTGYGGGQKVSLIIAVVFILVGSLFAVIFGWGLPVDVAINLHPTFLTAEVLDARVNRSVKIEGRHPTTIHFAYDVDGKRYEGETDTLDDELIDLSRPGDEVPVEVAADRPEWARLRGAHYATFGYAGLLPVLFPVIGVLLLFFTVRGNRREVRAYRDGMPVLAKVTYAGPDRTTKVNGKRPFLVRWEFDYNGRTFEGSLSSMDTKALKAVVREDAVPVLYLPENPRINTLYVD